jgi:hypothetical protein
LIEKNFIPGNKKPASQAGFLTSPKHGTFLNLRSQENDMSHPKNTTGSIPAQCPLEKFTVHQSTFWGPSGREMFVLSAGTSSENALKESSSLMAGALSIMEHFSDDPEGFDGNALFAVRFMLEGAKALVDGGTYGVEFKRAHGGAE